MRTARLVMPVLVVLLAGCGDADGPATLDVTMEDYRFEPSSLTVPAEQETELVLRNRDDVAHDFQAGRSVMETDDRPVGFEEDLFDGVALDIEPAFARHTVGGQSVVTVPPGAEVALRFTLPTSKAGAWDIGCFHSEGCHYVAGLHGELTVES